MRKLRSLFKSPIALTLLLLVMGPGAWAKDAATRGNLSTEQYLTKQFTGGSVPVAETLWPKSELRTQLTQALGHKPQLRFRYWPHQGGTLWVLNEIGKERPITAGVKVVNGKIAQIDVVTFRESRGWEIKYDFFTKQFEGVTLKSGNKLSSRIDGITGATLSVDAMTRMAKASLLLHEQTVQQNGQQESQLVRSPSIQATQPQALSLTENTEHSDRSKPSASRQTP